MPKENFWDDLKTVGAATYKFFIFFSFSFLLLRDNNKTIQIEPIKFSLNQQYSVNQDYKLEKYYLHRN